MRLDFGADVERGVVSELPPKLGAPFVTFVSAVDADGNEFTLPTDRDWVSLCRCGHSATKPFCDGTHKRVEFQAETKAGPT